MNPTCSTISIAVNLHSADVLRSLFFVAKPEGPFTLPACELQKPVDQRESYFYCRLTAINLNLISKKRPLPIGVFRKQLFN